jgi:hypothetical protein
MKDKTARQSGQRLPMLGGLVLTRTGYDRFKPWRSGSVIVIQSQPQPQLMTLPVQGYQNSEFELPKAMPTLRWTRFERSAKEWKGKDLQSTRGKRELIYARA